MGHDVHVFCFSNQLDGAEVETERIENSLTIHHFGRCKKPDYTLQRALIFLEWLHQNLAVDLVWSHYAGNSAFLGTWFAVSQNIRSLVSIRGNDLDRQIFPPGDMSRLRWVLENSNSRVAVSRDLAKKVQTLVGRPSDVLHNHVDTTLFHPGLPSPELIDRYQFKPDELVLSFSGELRAKKGTRMVMECFEQLSRLRPTRLLIIGSVRRHERGDFEETFLDSPELKKQVVVTGHLDDPRDIAEHLRLSRIFLIPSLWDGLPNSLLEAMATGLPVVASDAGAIPEVLTDGETGFIVPRSHLHQMAARIEHFLSKPKSERQVLSDNARAHVIKFHSIDDEPKTTGNTA